jgi:Leucine rich repeat
VAKNCYLIFFVNFFMWPQVLDIGFNLITSLPLEAFNGTPSLTLLALDGNPLSSVSEASLARLNATLRGLSVGGRFLKCDCKLKWLSNWLKNGELQVTSRERAPQFCGEPARLRDRAFPTILPEGIIILKQLKNQFNIVLSPFL